MSKKTKKPELTPMQRAVANAERARDQHREAMRILGSAQTAVRRSFQAMQQAELAKVEVAIAEMGTSAAGMLA